MKTALHILTLMIFGLFVGSCTRIEFGPDYDQKHLIGYEVVETKPVTKSAFPTTETFVSKAYKLTSGRSWDNDKADATNFFNNATEEVKYLETYWKTDRDYYWPTDGGSLTFFSYTPKSAAATISQDGVSLNDWNVINKAGQAFLVADIAKDQTKNESYAGFTGVPTLFRHKLAKVSFKVAKSSFAEEEIDVLIKSIKIVDVYVQGDYSNGGYSNDGWSGFSGLRNSSNPIVVFSSSSTYGDLVDTTPTLKGQEVIMIPQMLSEEGSRHPRVLVEYSTKAGSVYETKTAECFFVENFRSGLWSKGEMNTYSIYIGVGQYPIEFDGSVSEWASDDLGSVNIQ